MKLKGKAVIVLFLFSLFFSGCGSSGTKAGDDLKLISAEGAVTGYNTKSTYTYDSYNDLTNLYTKVIETGLPTKAAMVASLERASEYGVEYDDNGNITQVELWTHFYDGGEKVYSALYFQCDYTYTDNQLTGYILSELGGVGMLESEKRQYGYNENGELNTIDVYQYDYAAEALDEEPSQIISMTYDEDKNVTKVENKYLGDTPSGNTYVMTYNTHNQMEKHERFTGVDLAIAEGSVADDTLTLVYASTANTVTITDLANELNSTLLEFSGRDIGYLNMNSGFVIRRAGGVKADSPMGGSGASLAPVKLVQLLSVSFFANAFTAPESLLATQRLVTGRTSLFTGEPATEIINFDTTLYDNGYPKTMTLYDGIDADGLAVNFIWEDSVF